MTDRKKPAVAFWATVALVVLLVAYPLTQADSDEPAKSPTPTADPMRGNNPGDVRDDSGLKMKLVWCPPGIFTMETVEFIAEPAAPAAKKVIQPSDDDEVDPKEEPAPEPRQTSRVTSVKAFLTHYWLGKYEITQSEWKQVMKTEPWKGQAGTKEGADFPATYVDWKDAMAFCHKLTKQEREARRLPAGCKQHVAQVNHSQNCPDD